MAANRAVGRLGEQRVQVRRPDPQAQVGGVFEVLVHTGDVSRPPAGVRGGTREVIGGWASDGERSPVRGPMMCSGYAGQFVLASGAP